MSDKEAGRTQALEGGEDRSQKEQHEDQRVGHQRVGHAPRHQTVGQKGSDRTDRT